MRGQIGSVKSFKTLLYMAKMCARFFMLCCDAILQAIEYKKLFYTVLISRKV